MSNDLDKRPETALAKDLMSDDMKKALLAEVSSQIDQKDISFPKVKIVHQFRKFDIEAAEGAGDGETVKQFEAVILSFDKYRMFFEERYDPQNPTPPDCFSIDMVTGKKNEEYEGEAGGSCADCPQNKWGTAINSQGEAGKGKACQEKIRMFLMMTNSDIPHELHLSPTSGAPFMRYVGALIARLQYPQLLWTQFTLKEGNMNSAVLVCTRLDDMSADDAERWKEIRGLFGTMMQKKDIMEMAKSEADNQQRATKRQARQPEPQATSGEEAGSPPPADGDESDVPF